MTIGDVLAVVAGLGGICGSAWALIVTMGLLLPVKADAARSELLKSAKKCIGRGALLTLIPGVLSIAMLSNASLVVKMLGLVVLLVLMGCAAVGGAGLSFVAGDRLQDLDPSLSSYSVFVRSAGFVVGASAFPLLGWFALGPIAFLAAMGSGWRAVMGDVILFRIRRAGQAG